MSIDCQCGLYFLKGGGMRTQEVLKIQYEHFSVLEKKFKVPVPVLYFCCLFVSIFGGVIPAYLPQVVYMSVYKVFGDAFKTYGYVFLWSLFPVLYWYFFRWNNNTVVRYAVFTFIFFVFFFVLEFILFFLLIKPLHS